jgi:hypothetical protein
MIALRRCTIMLLALLAFASIAKGYLVPDAVSLESLASEADIIFKGVADTTPKSVEDATLEPLQGFGAHETRFKIISIIKGERPEGVLTFHHYDSVYSKDLVAISYMPQYYHFTVGKAYIVFAKKTSDGFYRQIWLRHTTRDDQGSIRCADDRPVMAKTIGDALWNELINMLKSAQADDIAYAIGQLDDMSGGNRRGMFGSTQDYDRKDALKAVQGLMNYPNPKIVREVIEMIGSHNPYMSKDPMGWLATVGGVEIEGITKMDRNFRNIGGELYWKDLIALADGRGPTKLRVFAILALGFVREPELCKAIDRWATDPEPKVRASAAMLLADFPSHETHRLLAALAEDKDPEVHKYVARAAGFSQSAELADVPARLLKDQDASVRKDAAMFLLSFSPKDKAIATIFQENIANREFGPSFLIALARDNPEQYWNELAQALVDRKFEQIWSGIHPELDACRILFNYLQTQPDEAIRSGKFDRCLDGMDAVGAAHSKSAYCDMNKFYVQREMAERASMFRETAKKTPPAHHDFIYFGSVSLDDFLGKDD